MIIQIKIERIQDKYKITKSSGNRKETDSIGYWSCGWEETCKRIYEYLLTINVKSLILQIEKKS